MPFTPLNRLQESQKETIKPKTSGFTPLSELEVSEPSKIDSLRIEADFLKKEAEEAQKRATLIGWGIDTIKGFKEAFYDDASAEDVPFVGGGIEAYHLGELYQISERVKDGTATTDEKKKLGDYFAKNEEESQKRDDNVGYYLGSGLRTSLQFGLEIMGATLSAPATGGTSIGALIAQKGALKTAKEVAKKMIADKVVREAMQKELKQYGIKVGAKGLVVAGSTGIAHVPADTLSRMIGDPTFGENGELLAVSDGQPIDEAMLNAVSSHLVEVGSEFTGGLFTGLGRAGKTALTKAGILKAITKQNPHITPTKASELFKRIGWNGVLEEFGEERVADATNEVLFQLGLGDQEFKMPTMRDLALELISFGIMGSGMKILETGLNKTIYKGKNGTEEGADVGSGDGGTGGDDVVQENAEKLAELVRSKLDAGASPSEVALELSSQVDTQEAKDFVESVVKKAITETKQATTDAVAETQKKLDALMEKVSEAKTASQANKLLEQALEQGTITQKKLDRIRELVPALAVDKATTPTKVKQPTAKKPKEGKTPTGEEVKEPAKKTLKVSTREGIEDVEVVEEGKIAGNNVFVHKNADGTFSVSERKTGMLVSMKTHKSAKGAIKKAEKELLAKAGSEEALAKLFKEKVATKQHINDVDENKTETKSTKKGKKMVDNEEKSTKKEAKKPAEKKKPEAKTKEKPEVVGGETGTPTKTTEDTNIDITKNKEDNNKDDKTIPKPSTDTGGTVSEPTDTGAGEPKPLGGVSTGGTEKGQDTTDDGETDGGAGGGLPVGTSDTELGDGVTEYTTIEDITTNLATIGENGEVSIKREPTENEKKVLATFKSGGVTKNIEGILDEYYTDSTIVDKIYQILNIPKGSNILEPSVATGNFIDDATLENSDYSGYEINETTAKIAKLLKPKASIFHKSFETNFIDEKGNPIEATEDYNLIVGNPPYGAERGRYVGLGEEKDIQRYEEYFTKRSVDLLQSNGILAFVLPSGFLNKGNSNAKKAIVSNGGYVLRAFRLPNKAFKGTDIGTDIVFIKKGTIEEANKRSALLVGGNYFKENHGDILGTERLGKDQFGKDKMFVDGTLADALAKIEDFTIDVPEHKEIPTTKAERQSEEKKDKAHEERKKKLEKEVLKRSAQSKKGDTVIANAKARDNYTDAELEMFDNLNSDMTVDEKYVNEETKGKISYLNGKWYIDMFYLSGDIYEKLENLETDKRSMSDEDYKRQKEKLNNVLPKKLALKDIKIHARDALLTENMVSLGGKSISTSFVSSLDYSTNYGGLYRQDVIDFINGKSVNGGSAQQNDLVRRKREVVTQVLMDSFLANLPDDVKLELENKWNRVSNSIHKEDYSKFPLKAEISKTILGNKFTVRESQLGLIGQIVVTGKGLGALEVGVGKTPASLIALNEMMVRGWVKKPIIVVPASTLTQWEKTTLSIIPNSTVNNLGNLSKTKDFTGIAKMLKENTFTILSHEAFQKIEFKKETYEKYAREFLAIGQDLQSLTTKREKAGVIRKINELGGKLEKGTESTFNFEDMGTDFIIFDELHEANNGITNIKRPTGTTTTKLGTPKNTYEFSEFDAIKTPQSPSAIALKTWLAFSYIQDKYNSRNVVGLSATPYTNSPVQIFFIASMFMRTELKSMGIDNVNAFIRRFIKTKDERIQDRSGAIVEKKIVNGFKNKGVFSKMISHFQETQTGENDPLLVRPVRHQKIRNMKLSSEQARIFNTLQRGLRSKVADEDMAFLIRNDLTSKDKEGKEHPSNIKIQNAMRQIAVSDYFLHEKLRQVSVVKGSTVVFTPTHYKEIVESNPRIMAMIKSIKQSLSQEKSGHIVYLDTGVALFPAIKWYMEKVEKIGNVEIVGGGMTGVQRDTIKDNFNSGKVDVILGTSAVRVGMNLQSRTSDIHFLSYPYNFEDYVQVQGRGWRHGNKYANIRMNHYLQENSYDVIHFQILSAKQNRRDDFNESVSGNEETDVDAEISSEDIIAKLISDPEVKANYEVQKQQESNIMEILNLSTESNRLKKKSEKLGRLTKEVNDLLDKIKTFQEELSKTTTEYMVKYYTEGLAKAEVALKKAQDEKDQYVAQQIEIFGGDYQKEIDKIGTIDARIAVLQEENKKINSRRDDLVKKYTEEIGEVTYHTEQDVKNIVAIVKKENETAFTLVVEKPEIKEETEVKVKEIKNKKGVTVKTKLTVEKKEPEKKERKQSIRPKKETKQTAIEKILTDKTTTLQQKINTLLDKKQEGKKYKDSGERVAGSKKENAVIQAVIEHGDADILRSLAGELGNEAILAQLDKKKLTEDLEMPSAEVEKKKGTPAFIANYKINVWNKVARNPEVVRRTGRYNTHINVNSDYVETFIAEYPDAFYQFAVDLNAISTAEQAEEFQQKYTNAFMVIKDVPASEWEIERKQTRLARIQDKSRSWEYIADDTIRQAEVEKLLREIERKTKDYEISIDVLGHNFHKTLRTGNVSNSGKFLVDISRGAFHSYREAKQTINESKLDGSTISAENVAKAEDVIKELTENYEKFVPTALSPKAKQLETAKRDVTQKELSISSTKERIEEYTKKAETQTGDDKAWTVQHIETNKKYLTQYEKELVEAKRHLARLMGEEDAVEHGNFQSIDEYDVKDTRFKKSFVSTENLMKVYGFKSAQLGNYMDDVSAHDHTVQAMGAMEDMEKITGLDLRKFAHDVGLSIAFGARGGGGFAVAHFEPTHKIINITKKRGDGSFGHEFMHAMDWLMGKSKYGKLSARRTRYYPSIAGDRESMDLTNAFIYGVTIMEEMEFSPKEITARDIEYNETIKVYIKRRERGEKLEEVLATIETQPKRYWQREYQAVASVYETTFKKEVTTNSKEFYSKSLLYGGGSETSYWVKPHELWARAFQAYLQDKMEELGIKNNYLTRNTKDIEVYPQGKERIEYNKMFDAFFEKKKAEYPILPQNEGTQEPRFKMKEVTVETADQMTAIAKNATKQDLIDYGFLEQSGKMWLVNTKDGQETYYGERMAEVGARRSFIESIPAMMKSVIPKANTTTVEEIVVYRAKTGNGITRDTGLYTTPQQDYAQIYADVNGTEVQKIVIPKGVSVFEAEDIETAYYRIFGRHFPKQKGYSHDDWIDTLRKAEEKVARFVRKLGYQVIHFKKELYDFDYSSGGKHAESYVILTDVVDRSQYKTTGEPRTEGTDGYQFLIDVKKRLNLDFDVMWVDSILSQDGGAWGVTHDNAIAIAKNAPKWTAEHETVHLTTANLNRIPIFQRNGITREKLLTAQAQQMGISATRENLRDIEEGLAEGFEEFMENKSKTTGIIRKFYNLLRVLVSRLAKAVRLTEGNIILDYYDILAFGEEVDNEMVVMERNGILEAFIKDGTMTIPALGTQFKTTGDRKTVYHGANSVFTTFDKSKIGETTGTGDWGDGFYFTDSKDVARSFGDIVMEIYLPNNLRFADGNKLEKLPEVQAILDDGMGFVDIGEYLKSKGYDGVKYKHSGDGGTEYVVYDPAQLTDIWNEAQGSINTPKFKLKDEKDGKVRSLKVRYNNAVNQQAEAENKLAEKKETVASEEDVHEYMTEKTKLKVSRKKLALLPAEIELIRKVVHGERVVVVKEVSRKLKVQRHTVEQVVKVTKPKDKKLVSAFQHRMMSMLDEQHQDDVTYNKMTKAEEVAKAEAYYEANKKRTIAIALGKEEAPADVSSNVIALTVIAKAQEAGDTKTVARVLPKLSLRATEQGQEISMLRDAFGASNPLSYMNKIIAQRKLLAKKKYKAIFAPLSEAKAFEELKKERVRKARLKAPKLSDLMMMKAKQIDDFLADITC